METDSGRNRVLCAIAGTVVSPNATFRTISNFPARYSVSSMVIFAAVCIVSFQSPAIAWLESDGSALGNGALAHVRSFIHSAFQNFMFIAVLFWIGGKYGENRRFKDAFPALSYCMIPLMVLGATPPAWAHLFVFPGFAHVGDHIGGGSLAGFAFFLIQNAFTASFMAWVFVLFVKATKISRGLGTGKAVGIVASAVVATYLITVAFATLGGIFVPLAWI